MTWNRNLAGCFIALALAVSPAFAERYTLYLNFDGDPNFPEYGDSASESTSPLSAFDASLLDPAWGAAETTILRNAILNGVRDDYREFDILVTDAKPASGIFQTVGIDSGVANSGNLYGKAMDVDSNPNDMDFGRVWAGSFATWSQWQNANSTLTRWTNAVVATTSHEAGHNYGLIHSDSDPTAGEIGLGETTANHIMASGDPPRITREQRATNNRHFSDSSFSKLGATLGLKASALASYGFINNNSTEADDFHIILLSENTQLTVHWESQNDPFGTPTITRSAQKSFDYQGKSYYQYDISWVTQQGNDPVQPGEAFKIGLTFKENNDFVITDTYLTNGGNELPVKPRVISPAGIKLGGNNKVKAPIQNGSDLPITIGNLKFMLTSRMTDLERMEAGQFERPMTIDGLPITILEEIIFDDTYRLEPGETIEFEFGDLAAWMAQRSRTLRGDAHDSEDESGHYDEIITSYLDLFPSAYIYGSADVTLHNQQIFDPATGGFITGDVVTQIFFQNAGVAVVVPTPTTAVILGVGLFHFLRRRRAA